MTKRKISYNTEVKYSKIVVIVKDKNNKELNINYP